MAGPRHLQDPLAHEERFKALKEEVAEGLEAALSSMFIPGMTFSFSGTFGGSDGKRPINPHTGKANEEFALCDGGTYKSPTGPMMTTPDMRGRFVMGASEEYEAGSMGGDDTHEHDVTIDPHTLTIGEITSHSHPFTVGKSTNSATKYPTDFYISGDGVIIGAGTRGVVAFTMNKFAGGSQAHPHTGTVSEAKNTPLYYASAYIMKL